MFARVLVCLDKGKVELSPSLLNETCPRHHCKSSIYAIREFRLAEVEVEPE